MKTAGLTDEMIEQARELIGVWLRRDVHAPSFSEKIAPIDIRRWAMYSMGDDNPLWTSDDYARSTIWGGLVAPPTFLWTVDSGIVAPGLRGVQWIYGGTRWEFMRPIRSGDQFTARARLIRVEERVGAHVARLVVQTGEIIYLNQRDQVVARAENDILRVPRRRSGEGITGFEDRERQGRPTFAADDIEKIRETCVGESRRGNLPLYWEDVGADEVLPLIVRGPLTMVDIVAAYSGRRQVYNPLRLGVMERERHPANVYVSPQTGVPMHPAAGHLDPEIAAEIGMPGVYDLGWMRANWMVSSVVNWMGDWGFIRTLNYRVPRPNLLGDATWCHARVSRKLTHGPEHLVEIEGWGENQNGERNFEATLLARLPSRDLGDQYLFDHPEPLADLVTGSDSAPDAGNG